MRDYLLLKEITITVEYLPRVFNQEADFKSRSMKDSSESKLKPQIFQALCNIRETPDIDLFVSQVSHQRPCYKFPGKWTHSARGDVFQTSWKYQRGYAFPPFNLIESLKEISNGPGPDLTGTSKLAKLDLVSPYSSDASRQTHFDSTSRSFKWAQRWKSIRC